MSVKEKIISIFPDENEIPVEFRLERPVIQKEYLVDGELRIWNGEMQEVFSPVYVKSYSGISRKAVGSYPVMTEKESLEALDAAIKAFNYGRGVWPAMPFDERIQHIMDFLVQMRSMKKEIVHLLMWETGKSYQGAEREFDRTVDYVNKIIASINDSEYVSSGLLEEQGIIGQIRSTPLGVVLCVGPYNYPLFETFTILIPALVMGNAVIIKPPKLGVLLHYPLLTAFQKNFPPGVVNTIYGGTDEVLKPLLSTGKIDCFAFTGSGKAADILKSSHPKPHMLRSILGLEAKNPAIILPDADIDLTVQECLMGSLAFNGQRCTALKILFVHSGILDVFINKSVLWLNRMKFGMPWEQDVLITPLPDHDRLEYLKELMEDALEHGAQIMNESGGVINRTFFYPALLYPVYAEMRLYSEEQFGPLIPVVPFDDTEVPVKYIIQSRYSQQVSIFSNDPEIISDLTDTLVNQVCRININSKCQRGPDSFPFSGRKDSGEGTLSLSDALRLFSVRAVIAAKERGRNKEILEEIIKGRRSKILSVGRLS